MKRSIVVLALAAVVAAAGCERKDLGRTGLVNVGKHTWALIASGPTSVEGLGANSGFVVGSEGVLVVDARYTPALARELLEKIRTVTNAPILYVVNTHYHQDHTWGNSVFKDEGAVIVARPETRDAFVKYSPIYLDFYRERGAEAFALIADVRFVAPDTAFADGAKLDLGGVSVELRHFGPGHTAGDAVVVVPKDRVAFTGGLLTNGYHPNLGDPGADFDNWLKTLDRLRGLRVRRFVPAQGLVCGREAIEGVKRYIKAIREICVDALGKRYPLEDVVRTIAMPGTEGWLQPNILPFNVQAVYRHEIPRVVNPDFALDLPIEFLILDGGGDRKMGYIRWGSQSKEGYLEIETQWKTSSSAELIVQDLTDAISRYGQLGRRLMTIERTRRFDLPDGPAVGATGTWKSMEMAVDPGKGLWSWIMVLRGGKVYVIQCATDAAGDAAKERRNIARLERIAETFRQAR